MTPVETRTRLSAELAALAARLYDCARRVRDGEFKGEIFDLDDEVEGIAFALIECAAPGLISAAMLGDASADVPNLVEEATARATEYAQLRESAGEDLGLFSALELAPQRLN